MPALCGHSITASLEGEQDSRRILLAELDPETRCHHRVPRSGLLLAIAKNQEPGVEDQVQFFFRVHVPPGKSPYQSPLSRLGQCHVFKSQLPASWQA